MNTALLKKCNQILDLVAEAEESDVKHRYKIAVECRKVRENSDYGERAMPKLADFLGWHISTLYDYANVAETWPDSQKFEKLIARKDKFGKPLLWGHLVELTKEKNGRKRASLIKTALGEGWSVAELANQRKTESSASDGKAEAADAQPEPPRVLADATQRVVTLLETLKSSSDAWDKKLPKIITKADPGELNDALDWLKQARQRLDELYRAQRKAFDVCVVQVEERLKLEAKKAKTRKTRRKQGKRRRR